MTVAHFSKIFNARLYENYIYLFHANIFFYSFSFSFILSKIHIRYIESQEVSKLYETIIWRLNTEKRLDCISKSVFHLQL